MWYVAGGVCVDPGLMQDQIVSRWEWGFNGKMDLALGLILVFIAPGPSDSVE
jgi:hypothetical protein